MPYTKHRDWFPVYLHDYRVTVSKIIPACLRSEDEGLIDDIYHALDLRSRLEEELNKRPKLKRYQRSIKEVDEMLLAQKEMLVKVLGDATYNITELLSHRRHLIGGGIWTAIVLCVV